MANILVIDDEALLLDLICAILRLDGHDVAALSNPLAAVDSHRSGRLAPIDLLLIDVHMKPISGFEVVQRLSETGFHGPVLFTSGYAADSVTVANHLDKRSFLEKPFTAAELRAAVEDVLVTAKPRSPGAALLGSGNAGKIAMS